MDEVRKAGIRRDKLPVCHGGALDPFASGLLLLLAGQATRLMDLIHGAPKTYIAEIAWGAETDNGDLLGTVTASGSPLALTPALLDEALHSFVGFREQVPPSHSNKRVGGERAYVRAHRGESFTLPSVRVYLHEARFLAHDLPRRSTLRLVTSGGYYVRALARDLGRATSALAHLSALHRTAIGPWEDPGPGRARVHVRGAALFPWLPSLPIAQSDLAALRDRKDLPPRPPDPPSWPLPAGFPQPALVRALLDDHLVALLRERDGRWAAAPLLKAPL